ncbi:MAG: diacylglyceryl transferase [Rickettsiales bacterium]|nr:diacylglyceryl transferase [Rickettsiales bacterium]|tara:strand:+ start:286 stop:588 length:303 start_codon:yes stop_codon:yes gene_type:complete
MSLNNLKKIFKVSSIIQLTIIFLVFAITGSLSLYLSDFVLLFFNISQENFNSIIYWLTRILLIFPIYQILLIVVGTIFGEFKYFWNFEKKMLRRLGIKIR